MRCRRKTRVAAQKMAGAAEAIEEGIKSWDPAKDEHVSVRPSCLAASCWLHVVHPAVSY
jgi:hypothetical protein